LPRAGAEPWPLWATLGAFGFAWLALSWPWLSGAVTIPWDAKAHFYPQLQFMAQAIARGESPFWAPSIFSGHPQIADPQSLIFSPYLILAALDANPSFRAADGVPLAMLGFGGAAIILLFRDRGWHAAGALVAALSFAFGASAAWRLQHIGQIMSLAWWPIALWLLSRAIVRPSWIAGLLAGATAGLMALGRDQVAFLGLWLLAGFVLWSWWDAPAWRKRIRASAVSLAFGALAFALVVAVPITLTSLLSASSNRAAIDLAGAGQGSLHPALLLTAIIPNLFGADGPFVDYWGPPSPRWGPVDLFFARNMGIIYIGALPIAMIAIAALRGMLWAREIRFVTAAAAAVLLYALGRYTPFFAVAFALVPGVDLFRRPGDATFLLGALGAILAGYAVHRMAAGSWPQVMPRRRLVEIAVLYAPFVMGFGLALAKGTLPVAAEALLKAAICLFISLALIITAARIRKVPRPALMGAIVAWVAIDLAWNNGPNESTALPPSTYDALRPETQNPLMTTLRARVREDDTRRDRVELTGLGFHWPNASLVHRLENVLGYNPVRSGLYSAATGAEDHVALPEQRKFSALFPSYRSTLADLLGLRFIATGVPIERIDPKLAPGDLTVVASSSDGFLYENPRAAPRVRFVTGAEQADFAAMLRTGEWPPADLATTVLLEEIPAGPGANARAEGGSARIVSYGNSEVIIETDAPSAGYVVLNDPFHPWWFATVDNEPARVLRANVLFRAVAIPAGRHTIRFAFRPLAGAWREPRR